jgi:hypothetical protein
MSEEDVREGLRAAVSDEPPLNFDPAVLVTTARQRATRRKALVAVGMATVAIAVAAVAIPAAFNGGTTPAANQPPSTQTSATTAPATWPPSDVAAVDYTADQLRTRGEEMRGHLKVVVPAVLPEASGVEVGEFGGEAAGEFFDGQNYENAPVTFSVGGARYSIFVTAWAPGVTDVSPTTVCESRCEPLGERDDGILMAKSENFDAGQKINTVYHFRDNGGIVQIAAYNYDMTGVQKVLPTIPVTLDQLMRLATDPKLGL